MQVIKQLFLARPNNRKKAFPATEKAMKAPAHRFHHKPAEEPGENHQPESLPSSHIHGGSGDTFAVSRSDINLEKNAEEREEVSPLRCEMTQHWS